MDLNILILHSQTVLYVNFGIWCSNAEFIFIFKILVKIMEDFNF